MRKNVKNDENRAKSTSGQIFFLLFLTELTHPIVRPYSFKGKLDEGLNLHHS